MSRVSFSSGLLSSVLPAALLLIATGCRPPSAGVEVVSGCALHGLVIDSKTRQPMFDVPVRVEETRLGAMTDSSGRFCIPEVPPGKYRLWIGRPGYLTKHLKNVVVPRDSAVILLVKMKEHAVEIM